MYYGCYFVDSRYGCDHLEGVADSLELAEAWLACFPDGYDWEGSYYIDPISEDDFHAALAEGYDLVDGDAGPPLI